MRFRLFAVSLVALMFALAQTVMSGASLIGNVSAYAATLDPHRPGAAVFQNDNEDDDTEDDADNDEADDDSDNDEADEDTDNDEAEDEDGDNSDDIADEDEDNDAADATVNNTSTSTAAPAINDEALKQPLQQTSGTSNGGDTLVATPGERVAVRMFSWMPSGVQVTIRPVDPNTVAAAPGTRAGDLMFAIEAQDASGAQLAMLPAEVNLAVRYADDTISGLNEQNLTISRLNPTSNLWQAAPKLVREPDSNYMAASIMEPGTYVVSAN